MGTTIEGGQTSTIQITPQPEQAELVGTQPTTTHILTRSGESPSKHHDQQHDRRKAEDTDYDEDHRIRTLAQFSEQQPDFFFDDTPDPPIQLNQTLNLHQTKPDYYQYESDQQHILGTSPTEDQQITSDNQPSVRRCFNCGQPDHSVANCTEPRNESLIRLTRQIFQAQKTVEHGDPDNGRERLISTVGMAIETTEDPLIRRKQLASSFRAGVVREDLRKALFWDKTILAPDPLYMDPYRPMPWFQAMERWGYPPGYAIAPDQLDPVKAVLQRLEDSKVDNVWESTQILKMHRGRSSSEDTSDEGEYDSDEEVLRMLVPNYESRRLQNPPLPPNNPDCSKPPVFPTPENLPPLPTSSKWHAPLERVVRYEAANFSSDRLPVYNGNMIPQTFYLNQFQSSYHYSPFQASHQSQEGPSTVNSSTINSKSPNDRSTQLKHRKHSRSRTYEQTFERRIQSCLKKRKKFDQRNESEEGEEVKVKEMKNNTQNYNSLDHPKNSDLNYGLNYGNEEEYEDSDDDHSSDQMIEIKKSENSKVINESTNEQGEEIRRNDNRHTINYEDLSNPQQQQQHHHHDSYYDYYYYGSIRRSSYDLNRHNTNDIVNNNNNDRRQVGLNSNDINGRKTSDYLNVTIVPPLPDQPPPIIPDPPQDGLDDMVISDDSD